MYVHIYVYTRCNPWRLAVTKAASKNVVTTKGGSVACNVCAAAVLLHGVGLKRITLLLLGSPPKLPEILWSRDILRKYGVPCAADFCSKSSTSNVGYGRSGSVRPEAFYTSGDKPGETYLNVAQSFRLADMGVLFGPFAPKIDGFRCLVYLVVSSSTRETPIYLP